MKFSIGTLAVGTLGLLVAVQPLSAAQSHLLQQPERHVTLKSGGVVDDRGGANPCGQLWDRELVEVSPTGIVADDAFNVPEGHVLVVTDIDWRIDEGEFTSFVATDVIQLTLYLGNVKAPVFRAGRLIADHADGGVVVESKSLTAGFRVGPNTPICAVANGVDQFGGVSHQVTELLLRGYLIQDSGRNVAR